MSDLEVKTVTSLAQHERVVTRFLTEAERPYPTAEGETPLVIEARSASDLPFLQDLVATHSRSLLNEVYEHGAVLLRGFKVRSAGEFEDVLSAIRGFRPMSGYFMSGEGRAPIRGTETVFDTNTFVKTGGEFRFGGVHSENYYSPDVPQFQCFCCLRKPWMGGETALFHMAHAYSEVRERLGLKLEPDPFVASVFPISLVAARYGLRERDVERFLNENDIRLAEWNGTKAVLNYKPSIFRHPHTEQLSLQVNLSGELTGLEVERHFLPSYAGKKWALHRLAWRRRRVMQALSYAAHIPVAVRHPRIIRDQLIQFVRALGTRVRPRRKPAAATGGPRFPRIGHRLDREDTRALGEAVWRHSTVFTWRPGDILIIDNLQMHHSGMPGLGPRDIKVIMANPVPMGATGTGVLHVRLDDRYRSLHERLVEFADRSSSRSVVA